MVGCDRRKVTGANKVVKGSLKCRAGLWFGAAIGRLDGGIDVFRADDIQSYLFVGEGNGNSNVLDTGRDCIRCNNVDARLTVFINGNWVTSNGEFEKLDEFGEEDSTFGSLGET